MIKPAELWADPRLVYAVAVAAVTLLLATIWLFRRSRKSGRPAAVICLVISVALHVALVWLVPSLTGPGGNDGKQSEAEEIGTGQVAVSMFDPQMEFAEEAGTEGLTSIAPLPIGEINDAVNEEIVPDVTESEAVVAADQLPDSQTEQATADMADVADSDDPADEPVTEPRAVATVSESPAQPTPQTLSSHSLDVIDGSAMQIDSLLDAMMNEAMASPVPDTTAETENVVAEVLVTPEMAVTAPVDSQTIAEATTDPTSESTKPLAPVVEVATRQAPAATVAGVPESDFANRVGEAKQSALDMTGGDFASEQAVSKALVFLANSQRDDGAWSAAASGAGRERIVLGENRGGAGSRADTAITGLALLSMAGSGQTHQSGEYSQNVFRGLAYLIRSQKQTGSLAGNASPYAATYSHGMAALAMGEVAAMTRDASAVESTRRAVLFTTNTQHPTTGGWRYGPGDPGDLSQLGWQAMVIDAGHRAGLPAQTQSVKGLETFLRSVRAGRYGGLAAYRPGESPSRTMTAEALATRLLIGEKVSSAEIAEAELYLLQEKPGVGKDNYYYWYYATLALHQLQDDAWREWNTALKKRLLETQRADGSWPADTVWGGYGGTIYTTAMATLCLETYYRHSVRTDATRIAVRPR